MQHSIVRGRASPNPNEARVSCEEKPKTVGHFPRLHVASSSLHCTAPPHHRRTAGVRAKTRRHKTPPSPRSLTLFLSSTLTLPSGHRMGVLASHPYPSGLCDLMRSPGPLIRSVPKDCWTLLRQTSERGAFRLAGVCLDDLESSWRCSATARRLPVWTACSRKRKLAR